MRNNTTRLYKIKIHYFEKVYLLEELIKIFLNPEEYVLVDDSFSDEGDIIHINMAGSDDRNAIKRELYRVLSNITGFKPEWGIITGIRPVKLWGEQLNRMLGDKDKTRLYMKDVYYISDRKLDLIEDIFQFQNKAIGGINGENSSVYIGIPFCPTRCVYCSFASNQVNEGEVTRYADALLYEIEAVGHMMRIEGMKPRSIYVGGGTPTSLSAQQLDKLLTTIISNIPSEKVKEITVECGRPDTIDDEKLKVLRSHGVHRISINPQTMIDTTLDLIGRKHKTNDTIRAFYMAEKQGMKHINADIIAGLPGETLEDFQYTLENLLKLNPSNITVHSLSLKRGSKLIEAVPDYHYKAGQLVGDMVKLAETVLKSNGYRPYYLYRQKHMAGGHENIGYCKDDEYCIYNMAIMDEHEDIIALGAGGISKAFFPEENRLERIPNVTNYEEYIKRIDEMIERKRKGLFNRRKYGC